MLLTEPDTQAFEQGVLKGAQLSIARSELGGFLQQSNQDTAGYETLVADYLNAL